MKSPLNSRAFALMLVCCLTLPLLFGFTNARGEPLRAGAGCSTASIEAYAPDVIDGSREVASLLRARYPARAQALDEYTTQADTFYRDWQRNKIEGLASLPALLKSYQTTIVPLLDPNNTSLQFAAAGLDFALRKFARYWQEHRDGVQQSDVQVAVAKTTAQAKGINLETADQTVENYLRAPKIEKPD